MMDDDTFWSIIELLDGDATDPDGILRPAISALAQRSVDDIFAFDDRLAEKLYQLDTREVARGVYRGEVDPDDGDQYISADGFLYARCVIVANGKAFFEAVLARPDEAPQDADFEALLYLARDAYEEKTGEEYEHDTPTSYESFSNVDGWKPTAATRPGRATGSNVPPLNRRPT